MFRVRIRLKIILSLRETQWIQHALQWLWLQKKTHALIPMCHSLAITHIDITIQYDFTTSQVIIEAIVKCDGKTGVEMEALAAVSVVAITVYDMCKAVDKQMVIGDIKLLEKNGGKVILPLIFEKFY